MKAPLMAGTVLALTLAPPVPGQEPPAAEPPAAPSSGASFSHLRFLKDALISQHAIRLALHQPEAFAPAGPVHHTPTFNGHPFQVSLAAYLARDRVIMVHAETLTDGSGALDYSGLEPIQLSGFDFNFREVCAELTDEVIAAEHDLSFLADSGFDPKPALFLRQYFMTSPGGNAEYVLSYGARVEGCGLDAITPEFMSNLEAEIRALIELERVP